MPGAPEPLEAARKIVGVMFDLDAPSRDVADSFVMNVLFYDLGPMQITTCRSSASLLRRSAAMIALTRADHFIVQFYRSGSFHLTTGGQGVAVPAGAVAVFDLARTGTIEADSVDNLALTIPRDFLLPLVAEPDNLHGLVLPTDDEANIALVMHLEDLWRRLPDMNPGQAEVECRSLAGMLSAAIGAPANRRSMARGQLRRSQFAAICRWIDENLADPALGPVAITARFHITRPTLYRMFEQRGGIMKYILQRRLEKVFHDLVDQSLHRDRIGVILHRWGLREHTSAGRAFRSYFGLTPRQARASLSSQAHVPVVASTERFRLDNMERLGPLLEEHQVQVSLDWVGSRGSGAKPAEA